MLKQLMKKTYLIFTFLATIGGAFAFYQTVFNESDYELELHLKSSEKLIEKNTKVSGLSVLFMGSEINSLYISKLQLKNTGKRAITKDFIYKPLLISIGPANRILQINSQNELITIKDNKLSIKWELLNPKEVIEVLLLTDKKITPDLSYKIKEISEISFIDEIKNPSPKEKLSSTAYIWLFVFLVSIAISIDAILLVKGDVKLGRIFRLANSLRECDNMDKHDYISHLSNLYNDYYQSVPVLFINPEELIKKISEKLENSNTIEGRFLEIARNETLTWVRHANLYSIRSINIFVGPLLFGFSVISILIYLFI